MSAPKKQKDERSRTKKVFASLAAVTMVGVAGVAGTTAALSATTSNEANEFDSAYINLTDNDADSFMYDVADQEYAADGSKDVVRCIVVTYAGTRAADVSLFTPTAATAGGNHINVKIEAGTTTAANAFSSTTAAGCAAFTPGTAGTLFSGSLNSLASTKNTAATGLKAGPGGVLPATQWTDSTTAVYKFTVGLNKLNNAIPAGENVSGKHTYTWQADTA